MMVTLQSIRAGRWTDWGTVEVAKARRHVERKAPGIWRAVDVHGTPVIKPRDVPQFLANAGHVMLPPVLIRNDPTREPVWSEPEHSPDCPCWDA